MDEKDLIGKTVKEASIDGFGVCIIFTDGTELVYSASDGGYSSWDVLDSKEE